MKYECLFDYLFTDINNHLGVHGASSDDNKSRRRPESSSPEKLKERNKQKYNAVRDDAKNNAANQKGVKEVSPDKEHDKRKTNDDEENYDDEEFEKLLDKDDDEPDQPTSGQEVGDQP